MSSSSNKMLMIFLKNSGRENAIFQSDATIEDKITSRLHKELMESALTTTRNLECDKAVFYSDYLEYEDAWKLAKYQQHLQRGLNFGEKVENAFLLAFKKGYEKVILIGSESYSISSEIITEAFNTLDVNDVVIGPANNGGYYLLGMKKVHPELFHGKAWDEENILLDTIIDMQKLGLSYHLLETKESVIETKMTEKQANPL